MAEKTIKIVCSDDGISIDYDDGKWPVDYLRAAALILMTHVIENTADEEESAEKLAKKMCAITMEVVSEGFLDDAQEIEDGGEENV